MSLSEVINAPDVNVDETPPLGQLEESKKCKTNQKTQKPRRKQPQMDRPWTAETFQGRSNRLDMEILLLQFGQDPGGEPFKSMTVKELGHYLHDQQTRYRALIDGGSIKDEPTVGEKVKIQDRVAHEAGNGISAQLKKIKAAGSRPTKKLVPEGNGADAIPDPTKSPVAESQDSQNASAALKAVVEVARLDIQNGHQDFEESLFANNKEWQNAAKYSQMTILFDQYEDPLISVRAQVLARRVLRNQRKMRDYKFAGVYKPDLFDLGKGARSDWRKLQNDLMKSIKHVDGKAEAARIMYEVFGHDADGLPDMAHA